MTQPLDDFVTAFLAEQDETMRDAQRYHVLVAAGVRGHEEILADARENGGNVAAAVDRYEQKQIGALRWRAA
jgi:hypothetical protein